MSFAVAPTVWRSDESPHRSLHRNECHLVNGANHDCREEAEDLLVHYVERKRIRAPGTSIIRTRVLKRPSNAIEMCRGVRCAEGALREYAVLRRHIIVIDIGIRWDVRLKLDSVRCGSGTNEKSHREWIARYAVPLPHELGCRHSIGKSLRLLQRQHAEGKATPCGGATCLARHPVVKCRSQQKAEVRLGLAATGREPNDVRRVGFLHRVRNAVQVCEKEPELEGAPALERLSCRCEHHGLVHKSKRG